MTRTKRWAVGLGAALVAGTLGCKSSAGGDDWMNATRPPAGDGYEQAHKALERPDTVEALRVTALIMPTSGDFHGYPVEQRVTVADPTLRARLLAAVRKADVRDQGFATACMFQPHHALRVTHNGAATDYLLCFHCAQARAYLPDGTPALFNTDSSAEPAFDAVLGPEPVRRQ